jgi:AraC family transcriptional regulator, regulatory protein of adaptative response / DNA-3-methyladenine glycosylase II
VGPAPAGYSAAMLERFGLSRDVLDRARRSRDARFDGKFFIAVTSTGIYCRSICPAKTSKDANVRYYATAAEAEHAGFRPCLRCRPESAPGSPAWLGTSAVVRRALRLIQDGALDDGSVEQLAARLGVGARHLTRLFTRHVGTSPIAVAQTRRLHFAKQLLDETNLPITRIALGSGFGSVRRFNHVFKATYRRSPREIRRAQRHARDAEIQLRLAYRPPYDWNRLCLALAKRAIPGIEVVSGGVYQRTVRTPGGYALVEIYPRPDSEALELQIRGAESQDLLALSTAARRALDLSADPARIAEVLCRDPDLNSLLERWPGLRIPGHWDLFESAVRALLARGAPGTQGQDLLARLTDALGMPIDVPESASLRRLFPTAADVAAADLETLGFAPALALQLQTFCRQVSDSSSMQPVKPETVLRALGQVPDDGPWLSAWVAMFGLGDPDVLPPDDALLTARSAGAAGHSDPRRPFRSYAALYLWQADAET